MDHVRLVVGTPKLRPMGEDVTLISAPIDKCSHGMESVRHVDGISELKESGENVLQMFVRHARS